MRKLYLFDCDGVLCDTEVLYFQAFWDLYSDLLQENLTRDMYISEHYWNDIKINMGKIIKKYGWDTLFYEKGIIFFKNRSLSLFKDLNETPLIDGAVDAFQSAIDVWCRPVIVTWWSRETTKIKLERSELASIINSLSFDVPIVSHEMTTLWKPHPAPYVLWKNISYEINSWTEEDIFVAFEDSLAWITSANWAGIDEITRKPTEWSKLYTKENDLPSRVTKIDSWADYIFEG